MESLEAIERFAEEGYEEKYYNSGWLSGSNVLLFAKEIEERIRMLGGHYCTKDGTVYMNRKLRKHENLMPEALDKNAQRKCYLAPLDYTNGLVSLKQILDSKTKKGMLELTVVGFTSKKVDLTQFNRKNEISELFNFLTCDLPCVDEAYKSLYQKVLSFISFSAMTKIPYSRRGLPSE